MKFTITGRTIPNGRVLDLTWEDGKLSGDTGAVRLAEMHAKIRKGEPIGPVGGPFKTFDYLEDPLAAVFLITKHVLIEVLESTGDLPEPPEVPKGAIV